ncbi:MAG: hypothetical protein PHR38_08175 [Bacteroidales bacterium]|nr:hypothetical protein [Bacteroidales bacterium]MDD4713095.1 hypothetical protein [Bacteroidales bacterium]
MKTFRIFLSFLLLIPLSAYASVEVVGSLRYVQSANPGEVIKGEIKIQNNDSTDQEVRIYQTDLLYNFQEKTFYDEPGGNKRSNAPWIQFSPKTVILKGKEVRNIEYEITVPRADSLKGTYWSVIMIEGVTPIDPTQKSDLNIRTVTRYAVQIVTEMKDKGNGSLKFMEPTLIRKNDKNLFLAIDLINEGDHYISPEISIELFDETGTSVKTITASKKGIYPTTSTRFMLDLEGLPSKKTYKAMIVAAGTDNDVFGLEYTLYF